MKVAIIGSRECGNLTLEQVIESVPEGASLIVSGGAIGADSFAKKVAIALNLPFEEILPDYKTFGKIAPLVRNKTIIDRADFILAFWNYKSKGTQNALMEGLKQDKEIKIIEIE
ncbi:MAG: hypothetical protein RR444_06775 [Oscillospiraceae bacterium]